MASAPEINAFDSSAEYYFQEGCHIIELSNSPNDPDVSIARARVEPGVKTRRHLLKNTTERYVIISGEGMVEVEGLDNQLIKQGDCVIIPPGTVQSISNTSEQDLVFLAICSPRFELDAYRDCD